MPARFELVRTEEGAVEAGGMDLNTLAEDAELVLRIHRTMRQQRRDYRIAFVPEPVCWTEVPHTTAVLARQRRRWSQGLTVNRHLWPVGSYD
jgi:cellulose synthase/poly-beta-1,6-N-acetylglucosamine synthase-like glycosyltransferase